MNTKTRAVLLAVAAAALTSALGVAVDSGQLGTAFDALTAGCGAAPPAAPSSADAGAH